MVLSTLHTNSAEGAFTRLVDLGVPEFIVRDVLGGSGAGLGGPTMQDLRRIRVSPLLGHGRLDTSTQNNAQAK